MSPWLWEVGLPLMAALSLAESSFLVCCELGGKKKKEKNSGPKINFNFKPVKLTELEMYTLPLSNLHCSAVFCMKRRFWSSS